MHFGASSYRSFGIGSGCLQPVCDVPPTLVLLASGTPDFLVSVAQRFAGRPALLLSLDHWRGRRVLPGPASWLCLRHRHFGGSTHFVALFGYMGLQCQPVMTGLRRNVAHVFEFGLRPEPVALPDVASLPNTMSIEDVLHPANLFHPILHPTTYYKSGWGVRSLTTDELGVAFGFPVWLQTGGLLASDFPVVPLQIMDGCL